MKLEVIKFQVVNFHDFNRPVAFLFSPVLRTGLRWYFLKLQIWQLSERVPVFPRCLDEFLSAAVYSFGLKFKAICRKEPDAVIVNSITGWFWTWWLNVSARQRLWVEGWLREKEKDLVWFKWGIKYCTSQGGLRSCPADHAALFTEVKPSTRCFQPLQIPWEKHHAGCSRTE